MNDDVSMYNRHLHQVVEFTIMRKARIPAKIRKKTRSSGIIHDEIRGEYAECKLWKSDYFNNLTHTLLLPGWSSCAKIDILSKSK